MKAMFGMIPALILLSTSSAFAAVDAEPINGFGVRLMHETIQADLQKNPKLKNTMTSPLSAYLALAMTANGAGGLTRDSLLGILSTVNATPLTLEKVNQIGSLCQTELAIEPPANPDEFQWGGKKPVVKISNGAWHTDGASDHTIFEFSPSFANELKQHYLAEVASMDFRSPAAADRVNSWVDQNTNGLIKKILTPDEIQDFIFLIVNTTYFEGAWKIPMYPVSMERERERSMFTVTGSEPKPVAMIQREESYRYINRTNEEVIELPFVQADGKEYVFYVVLPATPHVVGEYWNEAFWTSLIATMKTTNPQHGRVTLPKFAFDYGVEMTDHTPLTRALGLGFLFNDQANFTPMKTEKSVEAKVGLIKQVTRIELDEKGVKAAAATMVGGARSASIQVPPPRAFDMLVNHAFAFAIAEKTSGTLVFLGQVNDPTLAGN